MFEAFVHLKKALKLLSKCQDRLNIVGAVSKQTQPSPIGPHW